MRLADGPRVECEIEIDAPPERVWGLVSDVATSTRYSPELREVEWLDGAEGPSVGAHFTGLNRSDQKGEWRTACRISELREYRAFQWEVIPLDQRHEDGPAFAVWEYTLEPLANGDRTRLRHSMRLGDVRTPIHHYVEANPEQEEEIIDGRLASLRTGIEATLSGVKAEAESGAKTR